MNYSRGSLTNQDSVRRWLANIPNPRTRRIYLYSLEKYVEYTGMTPDDLVAHGLRSSDDAHDLLKMFHSSLGLASSTKMTIYQSIRSFYAANRVVLGKKPRTFRGTVEYEPRRLYTQDEVATLVDAVADVRDKSLITFLAQSGQRVGVVASLRLRHIDMEQPSPIVIEVPPILRNKHGVNVNKAQRRYLFAVGEDTMVYLRLMIKDRENRGEYLGLESWLFRSHSRWLGNRTVRKVERSEPGESLSPSQIGHIIRVAAERRGIQRRYGKRFLFHPHGFRRYWKHQLRIGGVDSDMLDYMMGHTLLYGGAYDRWTLEDVRRYYRRAENYVCLRPGYAISKEDVREEVLKVLLGNISRDDVEQISENLGIPPSQILSLMNRFGEERR